MFKNTCHVNTSISVDVPLQKYLRAPLFSIVPLERETSERVRMVAPIRVAVELALLVTPLKSTWLCMFTQVATLCKTHAEVTKVFAPHLLILPMDRWNRQLRARMFSRRNPRLG